MIQTHKLLTHFDSSPMTTQVILNIFAFPQPHLHYKKQKQNKLIK